MCRRNLSTQALTLRPYVFLSPVVFPLPSKAPEITKKTSASEKAALSHPHTCSPTYLSSLY
ncbi:hypothetical protein J6590_058528 [Homalodisca vitripennis]|nr:hypothetical protein J6590_058528 [Homalodisca vitripennis]